jgi:hypothetical protein
MFSKIVLCVVNLLLKFGSVVGSWNDIFLVRQSERMEDANGLSEGTASKDRPCESAKQELCLMG